LKFYGFQKTTLIDYPEKLAATIFTGGCNMREREVKKKRKKRGGKEEKKK